jgi:tetratricopeptide (TPR) repeat protein
MKAFVYSDKGLERYAGRFVWLSINTEAPETASFLKRYPIPALPTLLIIDPRRDEVALRYVGGANVAQMKTMLDDAERTVRSRGEAAAERMLAQADRLAAEGQHEKAAAEYEAAMKNAPTRWRRFGRAAESLLFSLSFSGQNERCATRATELYPRVKGNVSSANVAATGLSCATNLDVKHARRLALLETLENATREVFDDPKIKMSDDDRSGLYMALIEARDAIGDEEGVVALQVQWSAFLDEAAARAATPEQRAVYDSHRLTAYIDLGMPEKAIAMLEQSARDFPDDYNPPARLAYAYKAMSEFDKALAASDLALTKVYGPRKLAVLSVRADIFAAKGDKKAARETIEEAIAYAKSLPEGQRSASRIASFEKRLKAYE